MAKLSLRQRAKLPGDKFALPKQRGWPVHDKSHAKFALTQVGRSLRKGNISTGQAARIRARANQTLGQ